MVIDRIGPVFEWLGASGLAFRLYEAVRAFEFHRSERGRSYPGVPPDGLPVPPGHLIMKVAGTPEVPVFLDGGEKASSAIRQLLAKHNIDCSQMRRILDFGCGSGRVLRYWKDLTGTEVHGTDYNPELAQWCAANLPFARISTNRLAPPTEYPDDSFDLIYALSVFTHLPGGGQLDWMREFRRILRPGGHVILTTHGEHYSSGLTQRERASFESGELVVRYQKSAGTNLCSAFHPPQYVRSVLSLGLSVVDFVPEGAKGNPRQDAWLLRKPSGSDR